jgi:hypothetical protein
MLDFQYDAIDGSEISETLGDIFNSKNALHRRVADRLR